MSAWDFIGGFSDATLDTIKQREAAATDINKAKALEALRRETSDYEYARNKKDADKKVDTKLSYYDAASGKYIMVNSSGVKIGERDGTKAEIQADQAGDLELENIRGQIADRSLDNAREDRRVGLEAQRIAESRADRAERRSLDGSPSDKKKERAYALAQMAVSAAAKSGQPADQVSKLHSLLIGGIATQGWGEREIRAAQQTILRNSADNKLGAKAEQAELLEKERIAIAKARIGQ